MLTVGQVLWWVDDRTNTEGTVTVVRVDKTQFAVKYKGKEYIRDYAVLGTKLFYTSQLSKENKPVEKSCTNCFLRYSGDCTSLRDEICEDYRMRQSIAKEEMAAWPEHGDATTFRLRKGRQFIKKEKF
jgi:hypothetical protein